MLTDMEVDKVTRRLRRIKGQVEGIERMVEDHRYCIEVLQQIGAVRAALYQVGMIMLESHSRSCVVEAIKKGNEDDAITELMGVYKSLHK
ncbi:metal-sensitive transcriptional regulator [uncultured Veillonella sp.]|uniref:metal-sensitive transcriptional regulator n=1 Tax=uncultured Veillonella sp. TaxID=159268 RepID=UPI0025E2D12E|nr:metal-sensing transcriptional repressor [uncultured Veillonella sp.]MDY3973507.1 metal-sensing transcriptional repressor [Veillonella caviae]